MGAWRAGKTYAGCQEALKLSYLYPNNLGLIGRKDFTDLRDTTIKTFFEICPEDFIKNYNKTEHHLTFVNGSEILFRELKDAIGLGSLDLGWWYIDEGEEVEEQIFERLKGRLSRQNVDKTCGWITSNPPNEDHWIYKQFELNDDADYFTIHASTYENREYLPTGYIEDLEKLPSSWRKKYLEGQYGFTPDGTPYYQGYQEISHRKNLKWNPTLPLHCGWDSGKRHPAFVVTQWDNSHWKILGEILGTDVTIYDFVDREIVPYLNQKFPNAHCVHHAGPEFLQKNDKSDSTSYKILSSKGIHLNIRHSEYSLRKELIEAKLNTLVGGIPALLVDTSCKIISDAFLGGYRYPNKKAGQEYGQKFELPFQDGFYEHCMEALERIAVNLFSPIKQARKPRPRQRRPQFAGVGRNDNI